MNIEPVNFPAADPETEQAFGRFVITWAIMETQMDRLLAEMLRVDETAGMAVAGGLSVRGKLQLLRSLFSEMRKLHPFMGMTADLQRSFDEACAGTEAANDGRNQIIHGQFAPLETDGEPIPLWVKWSAGKHGVTGKATMMGTAMLAREISTGRALALDWNNIRTGLHRPLAAIALADADALLAGVERGPMTVELQTPDAKGSRKSTRSRPQRGKAPQE